MSIRYYNQTAPFWDFVASFEERSQGREEGVPDGGERARSGQEGPWHFPFMFGPHGGRGGYRHGHGRGHHHGGPPPPPAQAHEKSGEDCEEGEGGLDPQRAHQDHGDTQRDSPPHYAHHGSRHGPGSRRGRCGGRGGWGGGRGRADFPMGPFAEIFDRFQSNFFGDLNVDKDETLKPEIDVFDTAESFVVHVSLAGAKKEDVSVNWEAEKSELSIAGVIYRPGDEEFLKTLALDERKIGHFERKVRLGSRAHPAQVDVDGIVAKMEDGILNVTVPKLDSGYVEIKKVDIE